MSHAFYLDAHFFFLKFLSFYKRPYKIIDDSLETKEFNYPLAYVIIVCKI